MIKTLGTKVTDIEGAAGVLGGDGRPSTTILASSYFGFSLSTTQVVSGGYHGCRPLGKAGGVVHWRVVRNKWSVAWVLTLPAAGAMGALAEETVSAFSSATVGLVVVAVDRRRDPGGLPGARAP